MRRRLIGAASAVFALALIGAPAASGQYGGTTTTTSSTTSTSTTSTTIAGGSTTSTTAATPTTAAPTTTAAPGSTTTTTTPPPGIGVLDVSDEQPAPGQAITVSGDGCPPGSTVTIDLFGTTTTGLGSTTANGSGAFSTTVTIPADTPDGSFIIRATCGSVVQDNGITVAAGGVANPGGTGGGGGGRPGGAGGGGQGSGAGGGGNLPRTGTESGTLFQYGALLIVGGLGIVVAAQQRKRVSERRVLARP